MNRQEAIKRLSDIRADCSCFDDDERLKYHALSMAIEALQDEWIPVSERLPEDGYWLWSAVGGEVKKDFYYRGHWEIAENFGYEVIAWKPLPKPYKESEE